MRSRRLAAVSGGCALCGDDHDAAGDSRRSTSPVRRPRRRTGGCCVFLVAGAIVSTVFFGLAPALQATRLDLVRTMRGEVTRDARPGRARHALIAVQVGASALLLICAAIFLRGALAAATTDPGVRTSDTVRVSIANEPRRAALLQALTAHPLVAVVAASSRPTRGVVDTSACRRPEGRADCRSSQLAVSSEYFDVLGIDVVSGRGFTQAERTAEAGVVVVSETIARRLWPNGDGVGQAGAPRGRHRRRRTRSSAEARARRRTIAHVDGRRRRARSGRDAGMSYLDTFRACTFRPVPRARGRR